MQFAQEAKARSSIQAIIGAEITLSDDSHLTLLCETPRGYANLSRLLSRANLSSPRGEPRVALRVAGGARRRAHRPLRLPQRRGGGARRAGELRLAREAAERYRDVFGRDNYFIELQNNLVYEDEPRTKGSSRLPGSWISASSPRTTSTMTSGSAIGCTTSSSRCVITPISKKRGRTCAPTQSSISSRRPRWSASLPTCRRRSRTRPASPNAAAFRPDTRPELRVPRLRVRGRP